MLSYDIWLIERRLSYQSQIKSLDYFNISGRGHPGFQNTSKYMLVKTLLEIFQIYSFINNCVLWQPHGSTYRDVQNVPVIEDSLILYLSWICIKYEPLTVIKQPTMLKQFCKLWFHQTRNHYLTIDQGFIRIFLQSLVLIVSDKGQYFSSGMAISCMTS
jgi:hypothetical protein